ncbi:MAG: SPOR domain-containing protein [Motiliproteus sp.]
MTLQSKERLLGLLVLLALSAIFLPMLLDGDGARQGRLQAVLPAAPAAPGITHYQPQYQPHLETTELADPLPTPERSLRPPPETLPEPSKLAPPANPPRKPMAVTKSTMGKDVPVLDQQGVPTGWTLQLASFKERANAEVLQQRLLKRGYQAYIRDKGELSRVFVGPDLQKSIIDNLKRTLKREFKLDGLVLRFRP